MKEENKKPVCAIIDVDVWRKIKALAAVSGLKMAEMVEKALKDEIKMMEEKQNA